MTKLHRTPEAAELLGISFRQLDYWLRRGAISVSGDVIGSGRRRGFSDADIATMRVCIERLWDAQREVDAFYSGSMWAELEHSRHRLD